MAMEIPSEIRHLIDNNEFEAAIVGLNDAIEADLCNVACYLERARLNWKLGRRREAINDYYRPPNSIPTVLPGRLSNTYRESCNFTIRTFTILDRKKAKTGLKTCQLC